MDDQIAPLVEIHVGRSSTSAAASGASESRLSPEQIEALQATLTNLMSGFQPPCPPATHTGIGLESLEIELGFKLETGSGPLLKLLLDAKGEASIRAKVVWGRIDKTPKISGETTG